MPDPSLDRPGHHRSIAPFTAFSVALSLLASQGCGSRPVVAQGTEFDRDIGFEPVVLLDLSSGSRTFDFDADGMPDRLAVIDQPASQVGPYVDLSAFGYGVDAGTGSRCLLAATRIAHGSKDESSIRILCGASPILALQRDRPPEQLGELVRKVSRAELSRSVRPEEGLEPLGEGAVLQTQAGEGLLFLTPQGFAWLEAGDFE